MMAVVSSPSSGAVLPMRLRAHGVGCTLRSVGFTTGCVPL